MKRDLQTMEENISKSMQSDAIMEYVRTGDVSRMSPQQKNEIIVGMCRHLQIDPAMKPIDIIPSKTGEKLYLNHAGTDMVAQHHNLSREIGDIEFMFHNTIAITRAKVYNKDRIETGFAAVTIGKFVGGKLVPQQGEELADSLMKLQTKALRRATLAFCSAGVLSTDYSSVSEQKATQVLAHSTEAIEPAEDAEEIKIAPPSFISGTEVSKDLKEPARPEEKPAPVPASEPVKEEKKTDSKKRKVASKSKLSAEEKKAKAVEDKLAASAELEKENNAVAKDIKKNYSLAEHDFSIAEEVTEKEKEKEIEIEIEKFDAKSAEHLNILRSKLSEIFGEDWKLSKQITETLTKEFMPKTHLKEDFKEKGSDTILQSFIDKLERAVPPF